MEESGNTRGWHPFIEDYEMDIVERLRTQGIKHPQQLEHWRDEAADEIERLRAELEAVKKERDKYRKRKQAAWIEKAKAYLEAQCGDRCNAEYNPCEAREILKEVP